MSSSPLRLIDTHCHLNHEELIADLDGCADRARSAGVAEMIVVGFDLPSSRLAVELARTRAGLLAAIGIHPHDSRHYDDAAADWLRRAASDPSVVAIGEIGLDYHYNHSDAADQARAFRGQLAIAAECRLPIIIHCRDAYADVLDVLRERRDTLAEVVMHCWAGTEKEAERAVEIGCCLGFGGLITFKNADSARAVAVSAPTNLLLLETDAPYLAPAPYRGRRNEPAYTAIVAERLAELRGISLEECAALTTANALRVFSRIGAARCG